MGSLFDGLSPCAHFLLATIVGRELTTEEIRAEVVPLADQLGVEHVEDWIGELQTLLIRELVIRVTSPDGYRYRSTAMGDAAFSAWMLHTREEAM